MFLWLVGCGWAVAGWLAGWLAGWRGEIQFEWFVSIIVIYHSKYKHHIIVSFELIYQLTN